MLSKPLEVCAQIKSEASLPGLVRPQAICAAVRAGLPGAAAGKRRNRLKSSTLARCHAVLERRLDRLLVGPVPDCPASRQLFRAMRRDHGDLFRFAKRRDMPCTNNACERALQYSVTFRKVISGFRAGWGARVDAAAPTVIAAGRLHGLTPLEALRAALAG